MQPPNTSTVADAKKFLLAGTRYGCLLRGSARVIQIQLRMLAVNHWTDHGDLKERTRERTEGAERVCNLIGGTTLPPNQILQNSQGLKRQPLNTHGENHGSSYICSRGWHCLASMWEEAFGPVKVPFPSVEECQGAKMGVGSWEWEHLHGNKGRG